LPQVNADFAYGAPASTPALDHVLQAWTSITRAVDPWLDALTSEDLQQHVIRHGKPTSFIFGSLILRVIYHYWYHTGENMAIRQSLGHHDLPEFVGDIDGKAPYQPE
jgi:hypothetical protein